MAETINKNSEITSPSLWDHVYEKEIKNQDIFANIRNNAIYRDTARFFNKYRGFLLNSHVFEFGCGNTQWLPYIARQFSSKVSGIDYSKEGVRLAKKNLDKYNVSGNILHGIIETLPEEIHETFDAVVSFGLLEHFLDRTSIYKAASDVLKDRGVFFAQVPNINALNLLWIKHFNPGLLSWHVSIDMSQIINELKNEGYEIVDSKYMGGIRVFAEADRKRKIIGSMGFIVRKLINGLGEVISRCFSINNRMLSPYYGILARKKY